MKKTKIYFLLACLFILSGCTINYNITIENDIKENITINDNIREDNSFEDITNLYNSYFPVYINDNSLDFIDKSAIDGVDYYNKSNLLNNDSNYSYSLTYSHKSLEDYQNTEFWNYLLSNNYIKEDEEKINIWTGYGIKLFSMYTGVESINVRITTSLKALENNADRVEGNTYIWEYNNDNYRTKNISLVLEKTQNNSETDNPTNPNEEVKPEENPNQSSNQDNKEENKQEKDNNWVIILSMLGVFIVVLVILLKFRNK